MRPSIILPDATKEGRVDTGHDYSPEQFYRLFFIPIIGSGNQIQQPIAASCLYEAAIKAVEAGKGGIINAVSSKGITQKQLLVYFNKRVIAFLHIPTAFARIIAEHFPRGRLASYAVNMFEIQDKDPFKNALIPSQDFEDLLGKNPRILTEIYPLDKVMVDRGFPLWKHIKEIFMQKEKAETKRRIYASLFRSWYFTWYNPKDDLLLYMPQVKLLSLEEYNALREKNFYEQLKKVSNISSSNNSLKKLAIISGASGTTSNTAIINFLKKGYEVIAIIPSDAKDSLIKKINHQAISNLRLIIVEIDRIHLLQNNLRERTKHFESVIRNALQSLNTRTWDRVVGLNLIGGAAINVNLTKVNLDIPMSFFDSVIKLGNELTETVSFVQMSSITATINDDRCEYAKIKRQVENEMLSRNLRNGNVTAIRAGAIFIESLRSEIIDMGHDYSPDQFFNHKWIPIIGTGRQLQRFIGANCLYEAVVKAGESKKQKNKFLDAVSAENISQTEMLSHFNVNKSKVGFVSIPTKTAKELANQFSQGRFVTCAINMLEIQDESQEKNQKIPTTELESLLGRLPKKLEEIYPYRPINRLEISEEEWNKIYGMEFIGRKAPFFRHFKEGFRKFIKRS